MPLPDPPQVRAARRLTKRSLRARERRFLAEGPQAIREALGRPGTVSDVFATAAAEQRHADLVRAAERGGVPWHRVSQPAMSTLAQTVTPQGIVAVCGFLDLPLARLLERSPAPSLVAVCADVRDPGNAGTLIRCADAAGADAVVLAGSSVDPYNSKCVRASAGSLFHLPMACGVAVADAVAALRAAGLRVLAADAGGQIDLFAAADRGLLAAPTAWLFGNEAWGLPADVTALAEVVVRIPIFGRAESLNLATAAAVALYASARAQRSR